MEAVSIREARKTDARAAIEVLRQSISELCKPDHKGDPDAVAQWLSNKTEHAWAAWVDRDDAAVYIAEKNSEIIGVGMASARGEVLLNYVKPEARFAGVSKAILHTLEGYLRETGATESFLESTVTAKRFYESQGYTAPDNSALDLRKSL